MSLNRFQLIGRLGHDPVLEHRGESQTPYCQLRVATDRRQGEQTFTEWTRVIVWGSQAENTARYCRKGERLFIEGRLQTSSWETEEGRRSRLEAVGRRVLFLGGSAGVGGSEVDVEE